MTFTCAFNYYVLDDSLRFTRACTYLLYFFFHTKIPKDAKQYNHLFNDNEKYYKDMTLQIIIIEIYQGILRIKKTKYKQLELRKKKL